MTDWLKPIPGLHRRDPEHRYFLGDTPFSISVTGVLQVLKSELAMERIQSTAAIWGPRGTDTHRAMELFVMARFSPLLASDRCDRSELAKLHSELEALRSGDYFDWIEPLLDSPDWGQMFAIGAERPTCCLKRGVAGTFDLAYYRPSHGLVLADLKTLGTPTSSTYDTRAQLGGYMALEATWGNHYDHGQTIWARPGQTTWSRFYSRRECLLAWAATWTRWKQANWANL